jgi:glycosyltransferase involved in cell wall biosynthesis
MGRQFMEKIAILVNTLGNSAAHDETVMRMLMFARSRFEHSSGKQFKATIISVSGELNAWDNLAGVFAPNVRKRISVQALPPAPTPTVSIGNQKLAYYYHEFVKAENFDEIHCADFGGIAHYAANARQLGIPSAQSEINIHITGSTLFRAETQDALAGNPQMLMDDFLETGSVQAADRIYIHDSHAWAWYKGKLERTPGTVVDLTGRKSLRAAATPKASKIAFYGNLGADEGLPLFCDTLDHLAALSRLPEEVHFVGSAGRVGGVDAVTYIHLRAAKWKCRIFKKRNLTIKDEIEYLHDFGGLVVCNTVRRFSLRAHLVSNSNLPILMVSRPQRGAATGSGLAANPGTIAAAIEKASGTKKQRVHRRSPGRKAFDLWDPERRFRTGRKPARVPQLKFANSSGPLVSVCIAHHSRPRLLRRALNSLSRQSYKNFEVIVVDDGSPDPTVQKELDLIAREIRSLGWRLVKQQNRYLGAARNTAAAKARGEYLLFMDDDNVAMENEIATLVAVANRTGAEIVTTAYHGFSSPADIETGTPTVRFTPFGGDLSMGIFTPCFGDANALVRKKFFRHIGGFSEDYGITHEDWEFFVRAALEGAKIVVHPDPLFWYRVDENSMYRNSKMQLHVAANMRRHIRPYLEKLPHYQSKLVQLSQALMADLPVRTDTAPQPALEIADPLIYRQTELPFARVAIIIRTKNRPVMLRRALRRILDQTFQDWLAVVVNDGGDPDVVELVIDPLRNELADRCLVLHHPVSLGMQSAANAGILSCNSDLVTIHDDDDSWDPEFLNRTVSHLESRGWNSNVGGVVTRSYIIVEDITEGEEIVERGKFMFNDNLVSISLVNLTIENRFPPISFIFRRTAMEQIGYFNEKYGVLGDWDFHMRMLQKFEIDVIPEPLANYHHRSRDTVGDYGNSVHAQSDIHVAKRTELINDYLRNGFGNGAIALSQLVLAGDLQKATHDYMWELDQRIKYVADKVYEGMDSPQPTPRPLTPELKIPQSKNLVENGDFRNWPGVGKIIQLGKGGSCIPCPGFLITFEGNRATFKIEQRRSRGPNGIALARGKTYMEIRNSGRPENGSWLTIDCLIPTYGLIAGQRICVSGSSKLQAERQSLYVGAQLDLSQKRKKWEWDTKRITTSDSFQSWSVVFDCPTLTSAGADADDMCRIRIKLPYQEEFTFYLTDVQVEIGEVATSFVLHDTNPAPVNMPSRFMESIRQIWN